MKLELLASSSFLAATFACGADAATVPVASSVPPLSAYQCAGFGCLQNFPNTATGSVPGTGPDQDDSSGLNNWLASVRTGATTPGGTVYLFLPPAQRTSGWYDICGTNLTLSTTYGVRYVITGGGRIRIPPANSSLYSTICGAATPATQILDIPAVTGYPSGYPIADQGTVIVANLIFDAGGKGVNDVTSERGRVSFEGNIFRNVAAETSIFGTVPATPSANLLLSTGGQDYVAPDNLFANVNDPITGYYNDGMLYSNSAGSAGISVAGTTTLTMATFNVYIPTSNGAHDSRLFGFTTIGAAYAGIYDGTGNGNEYDHVHAWGYYNGNGEPTGMDLRSYASASIVDTTKSFNNFTADAPVNFGLLNVGNNSTRPVIELSGVLLNGGSSAVVIGVGFNAASYAPQAEISKWAFPSSGISACVGDANGGTLSVGALSHIGGNANCATTYGSLAEAFGTITLGTTTLGANLPGNLNFNPFQAAGAWTDFSQWGIYFVKQSLGGATSTIYDYPIVIGSTSVTLSKLAVDVSTIGTSTVYDIGVRADNGSSLPGSLIADFGTLSLTATGAVVSATLSTNATLLAGKTYWVEEEVVAAGTGSPAAWARDSCVSGGLTCAQNKLDLQVFPGATVPELMSGEYYACTSSNTGTGALSNSGPTACTASNSIVVPEVGFYETHNVQ